MKIYLAGPMRGYKDFNKPAFKEAATKLRAEGHFVFSPPEKDEEIFGAAALINETGDMKQFELAGGNARLCMFEDCKFICMEADAMAFLPGWEKSVGANVEWNLAKFLDLKFIYL